MVRKVRDILRSLVSGKDLWEMEGPEGSEGQRAERSRRS